LVLALGRAARFFFDGAVSDRDVLRKMIGKEYAYFFTYILFWFVDGPKYPEPKRPPVALTPGAQLPPSLRKRKAAVARATRIQELLTELDNELTFFFSGTEEDKQTLRRWLVGDGWRIGRALALLQKPWDELDVRFQRVWISETQRADSR